MLPPSLIGYLKDDGISTESQKLLVILLYLSKSN